MKHICFFLLRQEQRMSLAYRRHLVLWEGSSFLADSSTGFRYGYYFHTDKLSPSNGPLMVLKEFNAWLEEKCSVGQPGRKGSRFWPWFEILQETDMTGLYVLHLSWGCHMWKSFSYHFLQTELGLTKSCCTFTCMVHACVRPHMGKTPGSVRSAYNAGTPRSLRVG